MASGTPVDLQGIRALMFDLMGTCVDWKSSIVAALERCPPLTPVREGSPDYGQFAMEWRAGFFRDIFAAFERGEGSPDIDVVHRRVLDRMLEERKASEEWNDDVRSKLVAAWHSQTPWPDSKEGLRRLNKKFSTVVLANGTLKLQLDIVRSAGITFHALLPSSLIGYSKPDPRIYERALAHLGCKASEVVMIAAHAYDLRAAAALGIRTIYVQRSTEDPEEDMDVVRKDVDFFVDGIGDGMGIVGIASLLGV